MQVFQINTGSWNSIVKLNSAIDMLRWVRADRPIAGVWVDLVFQEQEAQHEGKKVKIFVMDIEIPVSLDDVAQLRSCVETPAMLPAPDEKRDGYLQPENGFAPEHETPATTVPAPTPPTPKRQTAPVNSTPAPTPPESTARAVVDDPDILAALNSSGMSPTRQKALMASAVEGGWSKEHILRLIKQNSAMKGKSTTPPTKPAAPAAKPEKRSPVPAVIPGDTDTDF